MTPRSAPAQQVYSRSADVTSTTNIYLTIARHGDDIKVVIPPLKTAVPGSESSSPNQRDRHLDMINTEG